MNCGFTEELPHGMMSPFGKGAAYGLHERQKLG